MSKTQCIKFIDIDSSYRNREQYPHPSNFVVKSTTTNQCGEINGLTAEDPVINGYPIQIFQGNVITTSGNFSGGTPSAPILDLSLTQNYRGALLQNTTLSESAYILNYNMDTHVADLGFNSFSPTFQTTDSYTVTDPSTSAAIFFAGGSILDNAYVGYYLFDTTIGEKRLIVEYEGDISKLILESPFSGAWNINDNYEIRKDPNVFYSFITNEITKSSIQILNPPSNDLIGKYVRITQTTSVLYNAVRRITAYDPATGIATINPYYPINAPILDMTSYEVLYFSYDNCYFVNMVSNCRLDKGLYEIELRSIILPNVTVLTGYGGRLVSYPYIYIEFGNLYGSVNNIIISNNIHSQKALFKVPIYDIQPRVNSNFLKIDKTNMPQLIQFNPYEDYYIKIIMPNGELFITQPDNFSPLPPNPDLQISVTFMISKINV
jgi:hypothetical protein